VVNGFLVVGHPDAAGVRAFRVQPRGVRLELEPHQRILTVHDQALLRNFMVLRLEDLGYVVIATALPADAAALLDQVSFDLVITDSFSPLPSGAFTEPAAVLAATGGTPVALFTTHPIELKEAQANGFKEVIHKPFDLDVLERQVRTLLNP
jgi:CheY-like chemotaxis protein